MSIIIPRKAELTDYGASQGVISNTEGNKKYGFWWLRSPGNGVFSASFVNHDGNFRNNDVYNGAVGLRPAFRLNLKNIIFISPAAGGKTKGRSRRAFRNKPTPPTIKENTNTN